MQPSDFYLSLQIFLAVCAAIVTVGGGMRWADKKLGDRIVAKIESSTHQIQPTTNGGKSLSDLHSKIDALIKDVLILKNAVLRLEDEVQALEEDMDEIK